MLMHAISVINQVNQLVEEETRRYRPTKNYLDFLATPDYEAFEVRKFVMRVTVSEMLGAISLELSAIVRPSKG